MASQLFPSFKGSDIRFTFAFGDERHVDYHSLRPERLQHLTWVHMYTFVQKYSGAGVIVTDMPVHLDPGFKFLGSPVTHLGMYENTPEFWDMAAAHVRMVGG